MTIAEATKIAQAADTAFEQEIRRNGFRSRWDWRRGTGDRALEDAYQAKIAADHAVHNEWARSRGEYVIEDGPSRS